MNVWPKQSECDAFYGNPRGRNGLVNPKWYAENIVKIKPPFPVFFEHAPVTSIRVNKKCASAFMAAFNSILVAAGAKQPIIHTWHMDEFSGAYEYRLKRNSNTLSMHGYGCAVDFAGSRYPMGQSSKKFVPQVIKAFAEQGAVNLSNDPMHFQFARVG